MNIKQILAILSTLAFCLYHITIDQYYRPNADDFAGMYYASTGIPGIGYAIRFYFEWEGPFLSMIVQGLWMKLLALNVPGVIILCSIKFMLLASSMYMMGGVIQWLSGKPDRWLAVLGGTVVTTTMYLISSEPSEIWHWVMGSVVYLHPILFLQLAIGLILRKKFYWSLVPLAYLMESRATYAVLFFGLIALITAWGWIKNERWKRKALLMQAILLVFLLIYLLAPGNSKRVSQDGFDMDHYVYEYFKELRNLFLSFNLAKTDRLLIGLMLLVPLLPNVNEEKWQKIKPWLAAPAVAYFAFAIAHAFVFVLATGYAAWYRVYSMHSFLFILCGLFYAYVLCYRLIKDRVSGKVRSILPIAGFLLLSASLFRHYSQDLARGKLYSASYDKRSDIIFAYDGTESDTLRIAPLPDSGVLYYWEFSTDPNHWINKDFRTRYRTEFHVALDTEERDPEH